jgi:hypothetical protein
LFIAIVGLDPAGPEFNLATDRLVKRSLFYLVQINFIFSVMNIYIVRVVSKASGQKQTQRQPADFLACSVATPPLLLIMVFSIIIQK